MDDDVFDNGQVSAVVMCLPSVIIAIIINTTRRIAIF